MDLRKDQERRPAEEVEPVLAPEDETLWQALTPHLERAHETNLCVSAETAQLVAKACAPIEVDPETVADLVEQLERAAQGVEFEAEMRKESKEPTLGSYLAFLRRKAGLTASEAAKEADWGFQELTELEQNRLSPRRIRVQPLAALLQRLRGSLDVASRLLATTVRAPRYHFAGARGSLYRGGRGASRATSEAASLAARGETGRRTENPEYRQEVEAVQRLREELRAAWRAAAKD